MEADCVSAFLRYRFQIFKMATDTSTQVSTICTKSDSVLFKKQPFLVLVEGGGFMVYYMKYLPESRGFVRFGAEEVRSPCQDFLFVNRPGQNFS